MPPATRRNSLCRWTFEIAGGRRLAGSVATLEQTYEDRECLVDARLRSEKQDENALMFRVRVG